MPDAPPPIRVKRTPTANVTLQKWQMATHSTIIVVVVVATTMLAFAGVLTADAIVGLFGSALGFAGAHITQRAGIRSQDDAPGR